MRRENKAMRLASALLVLTLLATSMIAGTFAKYTAEGTGSATARVAKFGVDVTVDTANLFGAQYGADNAIVEADDSGITVQTTESDTYVVAPGTTGSMTFSVSGTPEVDVELDISVENIKEVMLAAGVTFKKADETVAIGDAGYYPVKWTLKKGNAEIANCTDTTLAKIEEYLEGDAFVSKYESGTDLRQETTYTLSWEWAYDDASDANDTLLGDLSVENHGITKEDGSLLTVDTDYCLTEAFNFKITVTQAD